MSNGRYQGLIPAALSALVPEISRRIGLDVNIIDTRNPDQAAWLRAPVWLEHHQRRKRMEAALKKRNQMELDLRQGDGFSNLVELANEI